MFSDDDNLRRVRPAEPPARSVERVGRICEGIPRRPLRTGLPRIRVVPFHVRPKCVRPSTVTVDGVVKSASKEKYVERAMLLTKLTAILVYFDRAPLQEETEDEQKEPAKIGFTVARKDA